MHIQWTGHLVVTENNPEWKNNTNKLKGADRTKTPTLPFDLIWDLMEDAPYIHSPSTSSNTFQGWSISNLFHFPWNLVLLLKPFMIHEKDPGQK